MASVSSGIRRKVDDLGRVVIPAGIRRSLNIREGDAVEVSVDGERVVLSKPRDACVFCGREGDDLHRFRSRLVCQECVTSIGEVGDRPRDSGPANPTGPFPPASRPRPPAGAQQPTAHATSEPARAADPEGATEGQVEQDPSRDVAAQPTASNASPEVAWPTGPIDGDALAREVARRPAPPGGDPLTGDDRDDDADGHADDHARRKPPYDPASTTAW